MAGLFAGIGGIEQGFHRACRDVETTLLCEWWEPAKEVLAARFPHVPLHPDVRELEVLPARLDVLAAGFPCTDLSQAGRTAGIEGENSGLVRHVFEAVSGTRERPTWLMIENVQNMLALDGGRAMRYLVSEIEALGYRWAYRLVDSRFTGVPQRRRRVILLASATEDPRSVLFVDDAGPRIESELAEDAFGFYWTEGRGGLGWAQDAVPTLKGGSTIGIPSPPAIWVPGAPLEQRFIKPGIEDAEELQGFPRGWTATSSEGTSRKIGHRWKLVGNAVTVGVSEWVARRMLDPGDPAVTYHPLKSQRWPNAAWGERGRVWSVGVSEFPEHAPYRHLLDLVRVDEAEPLSERAAAGFWGRLQRGNLGQHPGFRRDLAEYVSSFGTLRRTA
nr:DNA cytosine methyltransferase [Propionibacterium sp.]